MANIRIRLKFDPGVVMYLVIIDKMLMKYKDIMRVRPTEKFFNMVQEQVMNHVIDGEELPAEIQPTIMNIADDMMAGREVTLRAGDYVSLMNFARKNKML